MSDKKSKRYDAAFKKEIAQLYLSGSRTGPSLAAELGLQPNTIYKWAQELEKDPEDAFPGSGNLKPEDQVMKNAQKRIKELVIYGARHQSYLVIMHMLTRTHHPC